MLQRKFEGVSFSNTIYLFPNWKSLGHDRFCLPTCRERVAWKRSHGFRAVSLNMESSLFLVNRNHRRAFYSVFEGANSHSRQFLKTGHWTLSEDNENKHNRRWTLFWRCFAQKRQRRWGQATPPKKLCTAQPEYRAGRQQWPLNMLLKQPLFCQHFPQAFGHVLFHF